MGVTTETITTVTCDRCKHSTSYKNGVGTGVSPLYLRSVYEYDSFRESWSDDYKVMASICPTCWTALEVFLATP